ncbi:MAG: HAD family phosphatase [Planctomycetaceae bacterium]|nr:HAD family phosphatase [Planctomycetaceae bacterium]
MLRTIIFDMGNVLVHFSHDRMCQQIGALCGQSGGDIQRLLIDSGLQWNFERGRMSPRELHRQIVELVEQPLDYDAVRIAASDIFRLNEPLVPVIDELRRQGHRLVLLSNTSEWHFEFIWNRFDVLQRLDAHVLSCRVGAIKPEPPIYDAILKEIGCEPREAFYTDDIAKYVDTGRTYGLNAEVFTDVPALRKHLATHGVTV